jgi:hypothetical protein
MLHLFKRQGSSEAKAVSDPVSALIGLTLAFALLLQNDAQAASTSEQCWADLNDARAFIQPTMQAPV